MPTNALPSMYRDAGILQQVSRPPHTFVSSNNRGYCACDAATFALWGESLETIVTRIVPSFSPAFQTLGRLQGTTVSRTLPSRMCHDPISERLIERRNAARYRLRPPVTFHWDHVGRRTEKGFTSDVGLKSALLQSRLCPPVGTVVLVELLIPLSDLSGSELRVGCIPRVTRVAQTPERGVFGIQGCFEDGQIMER